MTGNVIALEPDASAAEAWSICQDNSIRHLPICDGERLVGLVSDRDLRDVGAPRRAHAEEDALAWVRMRDIMSTDLVTVSPSDTLDHAARQLHDGRIGCLPVVHEEELVGIVTSSDMLWVLIELIGGFGVGSWVEVEVRNQPNVLAEMVEVLRESQISIASIFLASTQRASYRTHAATHRMALLRLESTHPYSVARRLEDAGYRARGVESSAPLDPSIEES